MGLILVFKNPSCHLFLLISCYNINLVLSNLSSRPYFHHFYDAGAYDDPNGSHITIEVVSTMFEGKRAMQRQQLVYKAIWEEMQGAVHAVDSMVCKTPDEA
jgi:stress-induced morphogen